VNSEKEPQDLEASLRPELDEALLGLDELAAENPEEALSMFETLPEPVQAMAEFQLVLARCHQSLEQLEVARDLAMGVLAKDDTQADAHHLLADLLEDLGDESGANEHFLTTLKLDRKSFEETSTLSDEELLSRLTKVLASTMDSLPEEVRSRIVAATHKVELFPTEADVKAGLDPRALSHFDESAKTEVLTLFAANLDAEYGDLDEFDEFLPHVRATIVQEIVDHLGLDAAESERLGLASEDD